jgi:hypothetical protein
LQSELSGGLATPDTSIRLPAQNKTLNLKNLLPISTPPGPHSYLKSRSRQKIVTRLRVRIYALSTCDIHPVGFTLLTSFPKWRARFPRSKLQRATTKPAMRREPKVKKRPVPINTSHERSLPKVELTFAEMLASDHVDPRRRVGTAVKNEKIHMPSQSTSSLYSEHNEAELGTRTGGYPAKYQHARNESLHVNWTVQDIIRMSQEITEGTIADVHLSLLGYWIRESPEHYETAKEHIRELFLDQVCVELITVNKLV